ncbi:MAG: hypothetical protein ACE5DR_02810 [Thermodesulfobacteriota bacterium]
MTVQKNVKKLLTMATGAILGLGLITGGPVQAEITPSSSTDQSVLTLESVKQSYLAVERARKLRGEFAGTAATPEDPAQWLKRVDNNDVNMVTNRLSVKGQKAVHLDGKDYYVPNDEYGLAFSLNPSLRFATDPVTGRKVDKSGALVYADYENKVLYFESEESYQDFLSAFSK